MSGREGGSLTFKLARSLSGILRPLVRRDSSAIKNAAEFFQKIRTLRVSFSLKSLYTSILKKTVPQLVEQLLVNYQGLANRTRLTVSQRMKRIGICLKAGHFTIEDEM